jgi:acyl-CoA thioester hydrolase
VSGRFRFSILTRVDFADTDAAGVLYYAAAHFDDPLELFVRVARIGRTSHTLQVRVERAGAAAPVHVADGKLVQVGLNGYDGRPSEMPAELRERLRAFEGDDLELA